MENKSQERKVRRTINLYAWEAEEFNITTKAKNALSMVIVRRMGKSTIK